MLIISSLCFCHVLKIISLNSCGKENKIINENPSCIIKNPQNEQKVIKGELITIYIESQDTNNEIDTAFLIIDGIDIGFTTESPFYFIWNTENETIGNHSIKVECVFIENATCSEEIQVDIIQEQSGNQYYTDIRDNKKYRIVEIGDQIWFADNLNYNTSNGSWSYNNQPNNSNIYGLLYDWETAQNACPSGWHLPSEEEWTYLINYTKTFTNSDSAGYFLKSNGGWIPEGNGNDLFGFTGLPGGLYFENTDEFHHKDYYSYFWSSSSNGDFAWIIPLTYKNHYIEKGLGDKNDGFSVRCLKDINK